MSRQIKDPFLEKYLAGDLPDDVRAKLEATLSVSEADRLRLEELRADGAAFLMQHPPAAMAQKIRPARVKRFQWPALFGATAALAVGLLFFVQVKQEDAITAKGAVVLVVHRRSTTGSNALKTGARLSPGDALRFEVRAATPGFVAIVAEDGSGAVSVLAPNSASTAASYSPETPLLPDAVALDETLGRLRITALFSRQPFELGPLLSKLKTGGEPSSLASDSVTFIVAR